jgi:hypothetical protein
VILFDKQEIEAATVAFVAGSLPRFLAMRSVLRLYYRGRVGVLEGTVTCRRFPFRPSAIRFWVALVSSSAERRLESWNMVDRGSAIYLASVSPLAFWIDAMRSRNFEMVRSLRTIL